MDEVLRKPAPHQRSGRGTVAEAAGRGAPVEGDRSRAPATAALPRGERASASSPRKRWVTGACARRPRREADGTHVPVPPARPSSPCREDRPGSGGTAAAIAPDRTASIWRSAGAGVATVSSVRGSAGGRRSLAGGAEPLQAGAELRQLGRDRREGAAGYPRAGGRGGVTGRCSTIARRSDGRAAPSPSAPAADLVDRPMRGAPGSAGTGPGASARARGARDCSNRAGEPNTARLAVVEIDGRTPAAGVGLACARW